MKTKAIAYKPLKELTDQEWNKVFKAIISIAIEPYSGRKSVLASHGRHFPGKKPRKS